MSKIEMFDSLLSALEAITLSEPSVACEQFSLWVGRVDASLEAAAMHDEARIWEFACRDMRYSEYESYDASFPATVDSLKAVLLGMRLRSTANDPLPELVPIENVDGARSYVVRLAQQANGCCEQGWYDASAVMVRRLIEQMIIDSFERYGLEAKIKDPNKGSYLGLGDLIDAFDAEVTFNVPRGARRYLSALKECKEIGDLGAHGPQLVTRKHLDRLVKPISFTFQALAQIAYGA